MFPTCRRTCIIDKILPTVPGLNFDMISTRIKTHLLFRNYATLKKFLLDVAQSKNKTLHNLETKTFEY